MKVGQVLYAVWWIENEETGAFVLSRDDWQVRTIRGGKVTAIHKNAQTWVKLSKKQGHWGWAKNIPKHCRKTWPLAEGKKYRQLSTTMAGSWRRAAEMLEKYEDDSPARDKALSTCRAMVAKCK